MENIDLLINDNKKFCMCGCGLELPNIKNNYIQGHYSKSKENKERVSKLHKNKQHQRKNT